MAPTLHADQTTRRLAALLAVVALITLGVEFYAEWLEEGDAATVPIVVWKMVRYFTILANLIVLVLYVFVAMAGRWPGASLPAGATVWILATGAVYHALLAATHNPQGIEVYSNIGLHTVVPLGCFALWLTRAPREPLAGYAPFLWTIFPLLYAIYAIIRGNYDGTYPYFFLNPDKSSIALIAGYILGLGVFFLGAGWLLLRAPKFGQA